MNQEKALNTLKSALKGIKKQGGTFEDFIYNSDDSLNIENYDIALTALGFDGSHKESEFDKALKDLFDNIGEKPPRMVVEMKGFTKQYEGVFYGISNKTIVYPTFKDAENKTNAIITTGEWIRLLHDDEVITDHPVQNVLKYWYKNKWVYVANKY